jgi:hypothetical protein
MAAAKGDLTVSAKGGLMVSVKAEKKGSLMVSATAEKKVETTA